MGDGNCQGFYDREKETKVKMHSLVPRVHSLEGQRLMNLTDIAQNSAQTPRSSKLERSSSIQPYPFSFPLLVFTRAAKLIRLIRSVLRSLKCFLVPGQNEEMFPELLAPCNRTCLCLISWHRKSVHFCPAQVLKITYSHNSLRGNYSQMSFVCYFPSFAGNSANTQSL